MLNNESYNLNSMSEAAMLRKDKMNKKGYFHAVFPIIVPIVNLIFT